MGIVEEELAAFELPDGREHRYELNVDGTIHLHAGTLRIDFSPDEFRAFADVVEEARDRLHEEKEW